MCVFRASTAECCDANHVAAHIMSLCPRYKQGFGGSHLPQAAGKFRKSFDVDRAFAEISLGGTCCLVNVSTSTAIVAKAQTFPDFITWDRSTGCYRTSKPPLAEQHWFRDAATATADRCRVLSGLAHRCALLRRPRCVCRRDAAGGGLRRNGRDRPVRAVRRPRCWCASRREGHPPGARNFHYCFSATDPHTNIGRSTEDSADPPLKGGSGRHVQVQGVRLAVDDRHTDGRGTAVE